VAAPWPGGWPSQAGAAPQGPPPDRRYPDDPRFDAPTERLGTRPAPDPRQGQRPDPRQDQRTDPRLDQRADQRGPGQRAPDQRGSGQRAPEKRQGAPRRRGRPEDPRQAAVYDALAINEQVLDEVWENPGVDVLKVVSGIVVNALDAYEDDPAEYADWVNVHRTGECDCH
jgi:hypothetical protein